MGGDFTGMGTSVVYGRLLQALFSTALRGAGRGVEQAHALLRRRAARAAGRPENRLMGEVLDTLLEAVGTGRLKATTASKYANVLTHFIHSLGSDDAESVTPEAVGAFLSQCAAEGVGRGAQRVSLSALRTVLDKLLGLETTPLMRYAPVPEPVAGASRGAVAALLSAAGEDMDRLLVLMLNVLKLRPGQIAALKAEDFLARDGMLLVWHTRPEKSFGVRLPGELHALLLRVLRGRSPGDSIFCPARHPDRTVSVRALQKRLARLCGQAGVTLTCTELRAAESIIPAGGNGEATSSRGVRPSRIMLTAAARIYIGLPVPVRARFRGPPA